MVRRSQVLAVLTPTSPHATWGGVGGERGADTGGVGGEGEADLRELGPEGSPAAGEDAGRQQGRVDLGEEEVAAEGEEEGEEKDGWEVVALHIRRCGRWGRRDPAAISRR